MENNLKWADVAHMYVKSGIFIRLIPYQIDQCRTGKVTINQGDYRLISANDGGCYYGYEDDRSGFSLSTYGKHQPILRHRDDMTEDEAREYYQLCTQEWAVFYKTAPNSKLKETISSLRKHTPTEFLWLLNRGFDMFRLIESGQAIRKEAANG